jgi:hypothetical protein
MAFTPLSPRQFQSLVSVIAGSATVDPGDMAAGAEADVSVTVPGAAVGDAVIMFPGIAITAAIPFSASVISANTVRITFVNATGDHVNMASSTWRFLVLRPKSTFAVI